MNQSTILQALRECKYPHGSRLHKQTPDELEKCSVDDGVINQVFYMLFTAQRIKQQ